jgi:glycosyltransferase involved in cell wall biosynthesis
MILRYHGVPRLVLPNKIFDYMFTGIPSIVNFYGPTKNMVEEIDCGVFANPEDPKELADKVLMLANDSEMRRQMGEKGRKIAWQKYDRKALAADVLSIFEEVFAEWKVSKK